MRAINRASWLFLCLLACLAGCTTSKPTPEQLPGLRYYTPIEPGEPVTLEYDVAVYGGTPAGVTAAIQSARMGKRTVLLSFDGFVGGMTSGGLTATDIGNRKAIGGLAMDFYNRVGIKGFTPSQAERTFRAMLDEAGVDVLLNRPLDNAHLTFTTIDHITMLTGETVQAKVFVDASYEGDLLASANVSYTFGREPESAYNETLAGFDPGGRYLNVYQFCRLPISPFVDPGDPSSGLLPEISHEPAPEPGQGDYKTQAYNFRMRLTNADNRVPYPKPRDYEPGRYDLLARFLNFSPDLKWTLNYTTRPMTDGPVQIRNGDSNNAGSFSSDYIGGNWRWPVGVYLPGSFDEMQPPLRARPVSLPDLYEIREAIFQDHVNYQLGLMYFLANDPRVPDELQQRVNRFGLDPTEFKKTGHWPHQLYIREGRRMVSAYVMNQNDCESKRVAKDAIGLAAYMMDSHHCIRLVVEEDGVTTVRNDGNFGQPCPKPYPIAYRSIVPHKHECTNLLVPVALSASHVAFGSIRMEPVFMILGQSAGTAAAMAIDADIAVQEVPYERLRERLIADKQRLIWE